MIISSSQLFVARTTLTIMFAGRVFRAPGRLSLTLRRRPSHVTFGVDACIQRLDCICGRCIHTRVLCSHGFVFDACPINYGLVIGTVQTNHVQSIKGFAIGTVQANHVQSTMALL